MEAQVAPEKHKIKNNYICKKCNNVTKDNGRCRNGHVVISPNSSDWLDLQIEREGSNMFLLLQNNGNTDSRSVESLWD
jgi:hypothetical protein